MTVTVELMPPAEPLVRLTMSREHALSLIGIGGYTRGSGIAHQHFEDIYVALIQGLNLIASENEPDEIEPLWARWRGGLEAR